MGTGPSNSLIQVADKDALFTAISDLLANPEKRAALGTRASRAVESRKGVVDRCAAEIV